MSDAYATGCLPSPPDPRDFPPQALGPEDVAAMPRFYRITGWAAVQNQGPEGTCAGHAGKGIADHRELTLPDPAAPYRRRRSARDLYEGARAMGGYDGIAEGAYLRDICKALQKAGVCEERHWPYQANLRGTPHAEAEASRATHMAAAYYRIPTDVLAVKAELMRRGPLLVRIETCEGFHRPRTGEPIVRRGAKGGGHAVVVLGWNDANRSWRIRNSWGTAWAEGGYADLSYDYGLTEVWSFDPLVIADPQPPAPPVPPAPLSWWEQLARWISSL